MILQGGNRQNNLECIGISPDGIKYFFSNQKGFAEKFRLNRGHIGDCLNGRNSHHKNWIFKYALENEKPYRYKLEPKL